MVSGDFTAHAEHYARGRVGFPRELTDRLLIRAGVRPGDAVVDIGAGTGLFTQTLCGRGLRVTAVEPNAEMRRHALSMPEVAWVEGTFEATGLPSASQRWAGAARAFQWADPPRALPEVRRILVPQGCFTAVWQEPLVEECPVLQHARDLLARLVPDRDSHTPGDWGAVLQSTGDFAGLITEEMSHQVQTTRDAYLADLRSRRRLAQTAGPERLEAYIAGMAAYLDRERIESFAVTWRCRAWTVRAL